ncbi:MAG: lysine--tRNA ligase [Roseimicrobium sp.]
MQEQAQSESELLQIRRDKLDAMRAKGIDAFGGKFDTTHQPGALRAGFVPDLAVRVGGRITARRTMGKAVFFDLTDITGRMQCYVNKKEIGDEAYALLTDLLDIGDWVGVSGKTFLTKTGEPSIHTDAITVLSKALRPMPDKFHGVQDREIKYRQRYLDLISNERSREIFVMRSLMVAEMRRFLQERGFLEVETPMMQDVPGGAAARPFETFFHALNQPMYLRIAPELYLKRLLVGGMTKIFELNRNFRNEGLSRRHNPEFTMLEAYWAFSDFEQMAELVESLVCHLAEKFCGGLLIEHKDDEGNVTRTINLQRPWRRASYRELLEGVDPKWFSLTTAQKMLRCVDLGVEVGEEMVDHEITQQVFEKLIEEKTFDPLFVTHVPQELVPLAKQNSADSSVVDVYELVINGVEISPGYSELNDPIVQRERLEHQAGDETQKVDEDFLLALEYGMPSAGGIGIGIDRVVMMLTGAESIRDVVLFPQLKRK